MGNILEELWYGNLNPQTKAFKRDTSGEEALQVLCNHETRLLTSLSEPEKEIFEKYQDVQNKLSQCNEADAFATGFRLGARLIAESFCDIDGFFEGMTG